MENRTEAACSRSTNTRFKIFAVVPAGATDRAGAEADEAAVGADEAVAAVGAAAVVAGAADEVEDASTSVQPALALSLLQRLFGSKPCMDRFKCIQPPRIHELIATFDFAMY